MFFLTRAAAVPAGFTFNPLGTLNTLQQVALGAVVLVLLVVTVVGLISAARKGNISKAFAIAIATIIVMFPMFIVGVGVAIFASSFFGWFG